MQVMAGARTSPTEGSVTRDLDSAASVPRYYVPTDVCGLEEGCRIGTSWLMRQSIQDNAQALMVFPSSDYPTRNAYLAAASRLLRWETALSFKAASSRGWAGGPTLLIAPEARVVGWFDQHRAVTALCVVQGVCDHSTNWARAFGPEDLTTGRRFELRLEVDPVVEQGLKSIRRETIWAGLTHADDIALAVRTLRILREAGHDFRADDLESWALREGWGPAAASRLAAYAQKVCDGRLITLRAITKPRRGALTRWRDAAARKGSRRAIPVCSDDDVSPVSVGSERDRGLR